MELLYLPSEIHTHILVGCDIRTLLNLSQVCIYYKHMCTTEYNYLWKIKLYDQIDITVYANVDEFNEQNNTTFKNWFEVYKYIYTLNIHIDTLIEETKRGSIDIVKYILQYPILNGFDSIVKNVVYLNGFQNTEDDITPMDLALTTACRYKHLHVVKYLVERGANIHVESVGNCPEEGPLMLASLNGDISMIQYLMTKGADIHALEDDAIVFACMSGCLDTVKMYEQLGLDIHTQEEQPLIIACSYGHLHIVEYLEEKGCNIHTQNDRLLSDAALAGKLSVIKYLINRGLNINTIGCLSSACITGRLDVVKYLVEQGADIHRDNECALMTASSHGHLDVVKYLIQRGARVESVHSAVTAASCNGHREVVEYLLKNGGSIMDIVD